MLKVKQPIISVQAVVMTTLILCWGAIASADKSNQANSETTTVAFESQVVEYIQKFPYQETFDYAKLYTGGDPSNH